MLTIVSPDAQNNHFIQADCLERRRDDEILNRFYAIEIIIHNVGGSSAPSGGFITVTDEIWQQNFNENLFPAFGPPEQAG